MGLVTKLEIEFLWRTILGTPCCDHCAVGDTADCDINPLRIINVTRDQAIKYLALFKEIP